MGDIKMSLAQEAAAEKQATAQATQEAPVATAVVKTVSEAPVAAEPQPSSAIASPVRQDETMLTLAPNEGAEIKVVMKKGEKVTYSWSTNGGVANFDVHGDSKELNIDYHGYYKGREKSNEGVLEAAFDGSHGWFWRNRTANPLTVTLKTNGTYTDIKKFQ
jgi:guanyl-specific ribonuclease Sa